MRRFLTLVALLFPVMAFAQIEVSSLRVNKLADPMGISPDEKPVLSWITTSTTKNSTQTAYEVVVSSAGRRVWSSGKVASDNSTLVEYDGPNLPDTYYQWSVRVWDNHGKVSKRATGSWQTALKNDEWKAEWIGETMKRRPVNFRREATFAKPIKKATAYITSYGQYEAFINGVRVGDSYMTPGWTSYNKRLQFQAYDVTSMLKRGKNVVAAVVARGWNIGMGYRERISYREDEAIALLMQVNIEYADGTKECLISDGSWSMSATAKASGLVDNDIYDGATIDACLIDNSWSTTAYTEGAEWQKAQVLAIGKQNIITTVNESPKLQTPIKAVRYIVTPKGEKVIDFGKNVVGWERVKLQGKAGNVVRIYHAETLDEKGNFYTINLRKAKTTSTYIMDGGAKREFAPTMTFYGFRYLKIEGLEGDPDLADFEIVPVWSGFDNVGEFSCSNPIINQLQSNIWWSFHDNFLDVPTDCPQRNERLGWTGDAQIFFRTATFLGRVDTFFRKYMADVAADQRADGRIPRIIPDIYWMQDTRTDACGWADVATIIPWNHYVAYGDKQILVDQYPSMKKWVDYVIGRCHDNNYLWTNGDHYGDWLFYSKPNDRDGQSAVTSKHLVAQCFFANSLDIMARSAEVLGKSEESAYYAEIAAKAREAFMGEYVTPNGLISGDTQTAYVLALHFNMLPEALREQAAKRLVDNIKRYKYRITTGFLGTPYICEVLTRYGYSDVAYRMLLQTGCPGWLFQVTMGATTIWERWDSIRKDGSIPNNGMNSLNHYSFGSIGDWLYRSAVGICETAPGYKTIAIRPHVGGNFTNMSASTETPYGVVEAAWTAEANALKSLSVEIPFNTTAEVFVPASAAEAVVCDDNAVKAVGYENGYVKYSVGSGSYKFSVK